MKPHPHNVLVHRRQRAADFLNDLGDLMFGQEWDIKYLKFLHSGYDRGTPGLSEVLTVEADFIEAMRIGIGTAEIELTDLLISRLYPDYEERVGPGGWIVRKPPAGVYPIDTSYWSGDDFEPDNINWNLSTIVLPSKYIEFTISGPFMLPKNEEVLDAPLYVSEPNLLLSKAVEIPPLATPETVSRYRDTQRSVWLEVMGVTWRLLAIEKPEDKHGLQAEVIEKVRHYMRVHQLDGGDDERGVSDQTMKAVVSKILQQWREQNTRDSVLVSSTARSR